METNIDQQESKPTKIQLIKDGLADWNREIKEQRDRPRRDKPSPGVLKVFKVRRYYLRKGQQMTDSLIAKKTRLTPLRVQQASKVLTQAGMWERTRIDIRDDKGHIRTYYNYQLTELGDLYDCDIPFYANHYQKTLDLITQNNKKFKRKMGLYFWRKKEHKKIIKSGDQDKNPTYTISPYSISTKDISSSKEESISLKSISLSKDKEIAKRMAAISFEFFLTQDGIELGYEPDVVNAWKRLSPWKKKDFLNGSYIGIAWFNNHKHDLPDGYSLLDLARDTCRCLDARWPSSKICPGHFKSKSLFNNWLLVFLWKDGTYYQGHGIEYADELPGIELTPKEQELIQKQRRKEMGEEEEEKPMKWEEEMGSWDKAVQEQDEYQKQKRIEREYGPIDNLGD